MAFNTMKKTDRRRGASYTALNLGSDGKVYATYIEMKPQCFGSVKQSNFNRTVNFKPGVFTVNPVEHLEWQAVGIAVPEDNPVLLSSRYSRDPNSKGGRLLWGDCAGILHATDGIWPFTTAIQPTLNTKNWALNNAYAKLEEADFSTAVWLAELRETIAMLKNPLKSFRSLWERLFVSTRKTSFQSYRKSIDDISSQWLEYRYGIMPVILDIMAIKKLYEDGLSRRTRTINRARKRKVFELTRTLDIDKRYTRSAYMVTMDYKVIRSVEETVVGSVFYRHNAGLLEDLSLLGLNAGQIPAYIWELVTLSFVVDWVVGIGDWLAAICPNPALDILGNTVSYKYIEKNIIDVIRGIYSPTGGPYTWVPIRSQHECTRTSVVRLVNQPKPWLPAVEPSVLNLKRTIDGLALTWGKVTPHANKLIKSTKLR